MTGRNSGTESSDEPTPTRDAHGMQVAQRHYDPEDGVELTTEIVFAVAEAEGVDPIEVKSPPVYETVDVPAIEGAFFGPDTGSGPRRGTGSVEFRYRDYLVNIRSDGWIQVYETTGPVEP